MIKNSIQKEEIKRYKFIINFLEKNKKIYMNYENYNKLYMYYKNKLKYYS